MIVARTELLSRSSTCRRHADVKNTLPVVTVFVPFFFFLLSFCLFLLQLIHHYGLSTGIIKPTNGEIDYRLTPLWKGLPLLVHIQLRAFHYTGYSRVLTMYSLLFSVRVAPLFI